MPGNGAGQSLYRESLLIKTPVGELPPVPSAPPSHSLRSFGRPRYSRAVSLTLTALLNSARFRFASGFAGQPTGLTLSSAPSAMPFPLPVCSGLSCFRNVRLRAHIVSRTVPKKRQFFCVKLLILLLILLFCGIMTVRLRRGREYKYLGGNIYV